MKTNVKLALLLIFFIVPLSTEAQSKTKDLSTVKFDTSIECEACVNTIMKNIPFEKGVKDVKCDLATKEVTIEYQVSKTRPELLKRALEKLGYTAKVAKSKS